MSNKPTSSDVLQANIDIHTALASVYNNDPHFRPENQKKVANVLRNLRARIKKPYARLLDMGCGTGFILHLALNEFDELHGIDITKAMMDQVDLSSGKITLHTGPAEKTNFANDKFDCVTAYSMMDHLLDLKIFLKEVYRVLEKGGIFYSDQNSNKYFWNGLSSITPDEQTHCSAIVKREINASLNVYENLDSYGVSEKTFRTAEYIKFNENGIDPENVLSFAREIGFSHCEVYYDWFLGQGSVMHGQSFETAEIIEAWLRSTLPLSRHLFKYLRFVFVK